MRKLWVVAKHEFLKITRKRSFLLGTLAMPLFFVAIMVLVVVVLVVGEDQRPIGYVDQAGVLATVTALPPDEGDGPNAVELRAFTDEAQARAALEAQELQAYYVLPADYLTSRDAQLFYWEKAPPNSAQLRSRRCTHDSAGVRPDRARRLRTVRVDWPRILPAEGRRP